MRPCVDNVINHNRQKNFEGHWQKDFYQVLYALVHWHNAHFRHLSVKGIGETRTEDERDWYDRCLNDNGVLQSRLVSQSVKEVLQSLVDDGLVQGDKIGSSNCELTIVSLYAPSFYLLRQFFGVSLLNKEPW